MNNILPEAHFEQITISAVHTADFEAFCQRKDISFNVHNCDVGECTYLIRAGIDYMDAQIMVYKMGWHGDFENAFEVSNSFRYLIFARDFWAPEYDYELSVRPRNKEDDINFQCVAS